MRHIPRTAQVVNVRHIGKRTLPSRQALTRRRTANPVHSERPEICEMTTTAELLDAAKTRLGLTSDYQLANALGWQKATVSNYRRRTRSMDLQQVADFHAKTGIPLEIVVNTCVEEAKRLSAQKRQEPSQRALALGTAA
jgi:hypothetical protein